MKTGPRHLLVAVPAPVFAFLFLWVASIAAVAAPIKISLPLSPELTRADLYVQPFPGTARGTLILVPGANGNGEKLLEKTDWLQFAAREHLNLAGISFASENPALTETQGYFHPATSGSGKDLLDGLDQALGGKTGPLLIYGFSRGGQFTYSFAHWKPERILAWCAYSATQWDPVEPGGREGKGIIACGEEDGANYGTSLFQFNKGRSLGRPWAWISLARTGHAMSPALDHFVCAYFTAILADSQKQGLWLDVDNKTPVSAEDLQTHPTLAVWLPDETVAAAWRDLHQP